MSPKVKPKPAHYLRGKITSAADALDIAAPSISTGAGKTYEAWVMLEIAAGLQRCGVDIHARNHRNEPTAAFKFRGGPGKIRPASSARSDEPCHFALGSFSGERWELHASVKHQGLSGDNHELDISVIQKREADVCRALPGGGTYKGSRIMGLELKQFGPDSYLDKGIPRAFLGVALDLDPGAVITCAFNKMARDHEAWFSGAATSVDYRLLTSAHIRSASVRYLECYGVRATEALTPENRSTIDQIAIDLDSHLWRDGWVRI